MKGDSAGLNSYRHLWHRQLDREALHHTEWLPCLLWHRLSGGCTLKDHKWTLLLPARCLSCIQRRPLRACEQNVMPQPVAACESGGMGVA